MSYSRDDEKFSPIHISTCFYTLESKDEAPGLGWTMDETPGLGWTMDEMPGLGWTVDGEEKEPDTFAEWTRNAG